jgi:acyl-CoA oxidase
MRVTDSVPSAFSLHKSMFVKTLNEQGTPEQHQLFLEPAKRYEIIGYVVFGRTDLCTASLTCRIAATLKLS